MREFLRRANIWRVGSLSVRIQVWYATLLFIVFGLLLGLIGHLVQKGTESEHYLRMRYFGRVTIEQWIQIQRLKEQINRGESVQQAQAEINTLNQFQKNLHQQAMSENNYLVAFTSPDLNIVYKTSNTPDGYQLKVPFDERVRNIYSTRGPYREVLRHQPESKLSVLIGTDRSRLDYLVSRSWLIISSLMVGLYVFTLIVGAIIVRRSLKPLEVINQGVALVASGKLAHRIETEAPSELSPLITELNNAFAQLQTMFDAQRRQSANASHELRTPVASMLAETQTTTAIIENKTGLSVEEKCELYKQSINNCEYHAQHMKSMLKQLSELSRLEQLQSHQTDSGPIDLGALLADIEKLIRPVANQKGIALDIDKETEQLITLGSRQLLTQAISSILFNCVQYTLEGGEIKLSVSSNTNLIELLISDTGVGIAKEDLRHIFERHFRGSNVKNENGQSSRFGTEHSGLGLAISKEVIDAMGGEISVESEIGKGTRFKICIPRLLNM